MSARGEVSVLTPVRDRIDHLTNLVAGLNRSTAAPGELLIGWMGGADPAPAVAAAEFPVRTIEIPGEQLPLARTRNTLARNAGGEALVFLDVDCVPGAGLIADFAAVLASEDVLAVGPTLYLPAGSGAEPEPRLRELADEHPARAGLFDSAPRSDRRYELFWSLNFALRRETFLGRIGGFDEGYAGYGIEDTDFALRTREAEVPLCWTGAAVAFHQHHPPTRLQPDRVPALVRNAKRYRRRWGSWPATGWLRELSAAGLVHWDEPAGELEPTV